MSDDSTFNQPGWRVRDVYNVVVNAADFAQDARSRSYLRMLAVLAAPVANARGDGPPEGRPLDVWGEWERLRDATNRARDPVEGAGAPWAVVRLTPPTDEALRRALIPREPGYQVVHFSCHGSPDGLTLEEQLGREALLPAAELVAALRGTAVRLVVLNACATEELARALIEQAGVPCVIATREPIDDREAKLLSEQLYGDLAAGASAGEAFEQARRAIERQIRSGDLPLAADPRARADNLLLFGDGGLRLAPGGEPAREPFFLPHPTPHNEPLPMDRLDRFVGRADELLRLARWFGETGRRAFAISGVGGMGKTALALNAALRNAHRFRALAFASAKDAPIGPIQALQALNEALNLTSSAEEAGNPTGAIARRLNAHKVLLVLDNLETLPPEQARELARALEGFDPRNGSRVLLTLRPLDQGALTALADRRDRLDLTALDRADALRLAWNEAVRQEAEPAPQSYGHALDAEQAAELERLIARARLPMMLRRDEAAALDELARLAFGHPALLKLAAAMIPDHGWAETRRRLKRVQGKEIAEALDEMIGQMLDDLLKRAPDALASLHAALPFVGGAAEGRLRAVALGRAVADDSDEAADFADRLLLPAVKANLLTRALTGAGARYDLDPPVRAYLELRRPPTRPNTRPATLRLISRSPLTTTRRLTKAA